MAIVTTTAGQVEGLERDGAAWFSGSGSHHAFLGIPFAAPPGRFRAPEPPVPWEGVRAAKAFEKSARRRGATEETIIHFAEGIDGQPDSIILVFGRVRQKEDVLPSL